MTTSLRPPPAPPPAPPPTATTGSARSLTKRAGLPSGRAVVGALLVVTTGVGTFAVARGGDDGPSNTYPVLVRAVDPGRRVEADAVEWQPMELDPAVATRTFREPAELEGAIAIVPMSAGDLVQRGDVSTDDGGGAAEGSQLSIPVPIDRTPPGLRRGERVALLATYGSGSDATTVVSVQRATVLGYETDPDAIGGRDRGRLTVALDDPQALVATAHAAQVAELTVVRTTGIDVTLPEQYRRDDDKDAAREHVPAQGTRP